MSGMAGQPGSAASGLDALAALGEPTRRALYAYIAAQDRAVSRDEAARATGTKRATAAFHLERLGDGDLPACPCVQLGRAARARSGAPGLPGEPCLQQAVVDQAL